MKSKGNGIWKPESGRNTALYTKIIQTILQGDMLKTFRRKYVNKILKMIRDIATLVQGGKILENFENISLTLKLQ